MRRTVTFCGKFLFWTTLVVVLVGAIALVIVTRHLDEAVRTEAQRIFAEHYDDLHVAVRSAHRVEGQGLFIRGLSVKDPSLEGPQSELLYVEEMFLACEGSLDELVLGEMQFDHIVLRGMALRAVRGADGSWSVARLVPLPSFGGGLPTASIENGTVELFDPGRHPPASLTLRQINMQVQPAGTIATNATTTAHLKQQAPPDALRVVGTLSADICQHLELTGWFDPHNGKWRAQGDVERLNISPEARQVLPSSIAPHLTALGNLRGAADLTFDVSNQAVGPIPYQFDLQGRLYDARYEDPRLPFPLTELTAEVELRNAGVHINNLTAQAAGARLGISLARQGWTSDSPMQLVARAENLEFNRSMVQLLPPEVASAWSRFQPTGRFDADIHLDFDGTRWKPELAARCIDVAFRYERFPYPFTGSTGSITLKEDVLTFALRTMAGKQGLRLEGRFEQPMVRPLGWCEFACDGPVPIDQQLISALDTEKLQAARRTLLVLRAAGKVTAQGRFERLTADQVGFNEHLKLRVIDGSVAYEKFPYPIHRISGDLELWNGQWTFRNLQGVNDSARITCEGSLTASADGPLLALDLIARDLPLEDELRTAFPQKMQSVWSNLRPHGTFDHVAANIRYSPNLRQCDYNVFAKKGPAQPDGAGQAISIYPRAFPYRLNDLAGEFRYHNGFLRFTELSANHGPVTVFTDGFCELAADGGWRLKFNNLRTDGLSMDRDLLSALPERFAAGVTALNVNGPVTVEGAVEFRRGGRPEDTLHTQWDIVVDIENGRLNCGTPLDHIHGSVRLLGANSAQGFYSQGELNIDSLIYQGFQFTRVTGPLWMDEQRVSLGAWAEQPQPNRQPRSLQAQLLGGTVYGNVHVALDGIKRFVLEARLDRADLAQFAREFLPPQRQIRGVANAQLRLTGDERGRDTLRGDGKLWLRNADLVELPLMVKLIKILKVKPLDDKGFTTSDVDFRITGEDVYLDGIVLGSDAVNLKGAGEVNLYRKLNVKLYALVVDETRKIPLVWPLLANTSNSFLMIEVSGTLDEPVTKRHVLPGLNGPIQQLFSEELGGSGQPRGGGNAANRPARFQR